MNTPVTRVLVLVNKHLPGISIYDADTNALMHTLHVETIAPHETAISRDGHSAFVPIYGDSGVGKPGTDEHLFHSFDTRTGERKSTLDTGELRRLHSVAVGASGLVYVSAEASSAVVIIDPRTATVQGSIDTGFSTSHMIALSADETTLYTSNVWAESISVLDVPTRTLTSVLKTEGPNQRITLSPDELHFVTSLGPARKVLGVSTRTSKPDFEIAVDGHPFTAKYSRGGESIFNVGTRDGETCVWKIDLESRTVAQAVYGLGGDPGSLEVNPFTGEVYVTDQPTRKLMIFDPQTLALQHSITTEPSPDAMAFATIRDPTN